MSDLEAADSQNCEDSAENARIFFDEVKFTTSYESFIVAMTIIVRSRNGQRKKLKMSLK